MKRAIELSLTIILAALVLNVKAQPNTTIISGTIRNYKPGDSVKLRVWDELVNMRKRPYLASRELISKNDNSDFKFTIPDLQEYVYITLLSGKVKKFNTSLEILGNPGREFFFINSGDSIHMDIRPDTIIFSGRGKDKLEAQYQMWKNSSNLAKVIAKKNHAVKNRFLEGSLFLGYDELINFIKEADIHKEANDTVLSRYKDKLPKDFFEVLSWNNTFKYQTQLVLFGQRFVSTLKQQKADPKYRAESTAEINRELEKVIAYYRSAEFKKKLKPGKNELAFYTFENLSNHFNLAAFKHFPEPMTAAGTQEYLTGMKSGKLKDLLILKYQIDSAGRGLTEQQKLALIAQMANKKYQLIANSFMEEQLVGQKAYDFELKDVDGKLVRLSDLKGKVVFIDFWFKGCGACSSYYKNTLAEIEENYKTNNNMVFVTISVDASKMVFEESVKSGLYTSTGKTNVKNLSIGPQGTSHPLIKHYKIKGYPQPMVIGKDGNVFNASQLKLTNKDYLIETLNRALNSK